MAKYELSLTVENANLEVTPEGPVTLSVLELIGPRGETGPQGPAGTTLLSGLSDVDTSNAQTGRVLASDGDNSFSFIDIGTLDTLDDVTSRGSTTTNDISVGAVTATSLNTHAIPSGTGTLAKTSDIPTNNNQLTNGAGYITDYTVTQGDVTAHQAALSITESQISDLQSYITDYTVTEADVTAHQAALSITESQISDFGTYATLVGGTVPASQLPSYVDDVEEYTNYASFPASGETGKIYVDLATGDIYRWAGSAYVQINDAVSSADQATRLATARTISLGGDVSGSASFDGSANVTITAAVADDSHNHLISNVDGLQSALDGKLATTATTDDVSEGSTNLYYTDARADARVAAATGVNLSLTNQDTDDLSEGTTNLYYTDARADARVNTANVRAAGALMDDEVTNLAQVKAFDSSDYATAAQGALADTAVQPSDDRFNIRILAAEETLPSGYIDTGGVLTDSASVTYRVISKNLPSSIINSGTEGGLISFHAVGDL